MNVNSWICICENMSREYDPIRCQLGEQKINFRIYSGIQYNKFNWYQVFLLTKIPIVRIERLCMELVVHQARIQCHFGP